MFYIKLFILLFLTITSTHTYALPSEMTVLSDIPYGKDVDQVLDVYIPADAKGAPVIFMIHGGAWSGGDKANKAEFEYKIAHWVAQGFIFISTNIVHFRKSGLLNKQKMLKLLYFFLKKM